MQCHACGMAAERAAGERVGFQETCAGCGADLHVCRNCAHHDPAAYNECRETSAERVSERERANRCEYFRPGEGAPGGPGEARASALEQLDALFKKR